MEYKGIVDNGVIRPFEPMDFPDGTVVAFHEVANGTGTATFPSGEVADWQSMRERFQRSFSIEELAQEQGVTPVASLDDLVGEWPEEDDIDEFLRSIRHAQRKALC